MPPPDADLELLVSLRGGNTHEAVVYLDLGDAALAAASCQLLQPLVPGRPAPEASMIPAVGTPMRVEFLQRLSDDDKPEQLPEQWRKIDASCLLQDARSQRQFPALPFIYTGSQTVVVERERDGKTETRRYFGLASGRRGWANIYDDPDALLASPLPLAGDDTATRPVPSLQLPDATEIIVAVTTDNIAADSAG